MKSVFVIWKDIVDSMWHPVAKLTRVDDSYTLSYTKGSNHCRFIPFPRMSDRSAVYRSNELFSLFTNRLIPSNRPEFKKILDWSDVMLKDYDELDILSLSGGARKTDEYRIVPLPVPDKNNFYKLRFFTSGVSHLEDDSVQQISELRPGERLEFSYENSNKFDKNAVLVTSKSKVRVGYCPKYYNCDVRNLLGNPQLLDYSLSVVKVNLDAPAHFRLLCEFITKWPEGFQPFLTSEFEAYTKNYLDEKCN